MRSSWKECAAAHFFHPQFILQQHRTYPGNILLWFCSNHNNQFNVANTDKHSWHQRMERNTSWWLNTIKKGVRFVQSSYTVWQAFPTNTHHEPLESCCCSRLFFIQSIAPHRSPLGSPLIELVFLLAFSSSQRDQLSDWRSYLSTYYIRAF